MRGALRNKGKLGKDGVRLPKIIVLTHRRWHGRTRRCAHAPQQSCPPGREVPAPASKVRQRSCRGRSPQNLDFLTVIFDDFSPGMRSIHPHKCHLCGWIERIPGGTRQNDGQETGLGREISVGGVNRLLCPADSGEAAGCLLLCARAGARWPGIGVDEPSSPWRPSARPCA